MTAALHFLKQDSFIYSFKWAAGKRLIGLRQFICCFILEMRQEGVSQISFLPKNQMTVLIQCHVGWMKAIIIMKNISCGVKNTWGGTLAHYYSRELIWNANTLNYLLLFSSNRHNCKTNISVSDIYSRMVVFFLCN